MFFSDLSEAFQLRKTGMLFQKCIALIFCVLNQLDAYNSDVIRSVDIAINYVKKFLFPQNEDSVANSKTLVCIVDFIWGGIKQSEEFTEKFLSKGGVYFLLDLLQVRKFSWLHKFRCVRLQLRETNFL